MRGVQPPDGWGDGVTTYHKPCGTVLEVVARRDGPDGREVQVRYIAPLVTATISEWYGEIALELAGWERREPNAEAESSAGSEE